jgi:hypothetical protein
MTTDPTKLSIKELLGRMTVGQVWGIAAAIFALIAGSFTIGYKVSENLKAKTTISVESLEDEVTGLSEKNRFLGLYLRFMLAKNNLDLDNFDDDPWESYEKARDALDKFVRERVENESLILHKGGDLATIRFKDGTVWELPPDIHMIEEH